MQCSILFLAVLKCICTRDFVHMEKLFDYYFTDAFTAILKMVQVKDLNLLLCGSLSGRRGELSGQRFSCLFVVEH